MRYKMRHKAVFGAHVAGVLLLTAALGGTALRMTTASAAGTTQGTTQQDYYAPHINPSDFTTKIDNIYFPLKPATSFLYQGMSAATTQRDVMAVTHSTKRIMGVKRSGSFRVRLCPPDVTHLFHALR